MPDDYVDLTEEEIEDSPPLFQEQVAFYYKNTDSDEVGLQCVFDEGAHLASVAAMFRRFLVAAGYDYVTEVIVVTGEDEDDLVSSNDIGLD